MHWLAGETFVLGLVLLGAIARHTGGGSDE